MCSTVEINVKRLSRGLSSVLMVLLVLYSQEGTLLEQLYVSASALYLQCVHAHLCSL